MQHVPLAPGYMGPAGGRGGCRPGRRRFPGPLGLGGAPANQAGGAAGQRAGGQWAALSEGAKAGIRKQGVWNI